MIEATGLPSLDAMAFVAGLAQPLLVRVVFVMTVIACRKRITVFGIFLMAAGAGKPQMGAFQRKIGLMMIECIRVEMHDVGIAPYMLGMACLAGQFVNIFNATVKSLVMFYIRRYFLMAVEAQMLLCGFFEGLMAFLTLGFILGMGAYHLARHDQRFQAGRGSG